MIDLLNITPNVVQTGLANKTFMFYGDPSTRKTTIASKFPKSLILATEIGYSLIPGVKAQPIKNWAEFINVIRELEREEVKEVYQTIVIDTVGLLTDMCSQYICQLNGIKELGELGYGKGWTLFKNEFRRRVNKIAQLGYGIVFISHAEVKRDDNGNIISALPQMEKRPRETVLALVDFILFLQKEAKDEDPSITTVYAYSDLPSKIETKTRARYLSKRFEFTYENLEKEVKIAVEKLTNDYGQDSISDNVTNFRETHDDFESLKEEIISIASELIEKPVVGEKAEQLIVNCMGGVPISEAPKTYYDTFVSLKTALLELEE